MGLPEQLQRDEVALVAKTIPPEPKRRSEDASSGIDAEKMVV